MNNVMVGKFDRIVENALYNERFERRKREYELTGLNPRILWGSIIHAVLCFNAWISRNITFISIGSDN